MIKQLISSFEAKPQRKSLGRESTNFSIGLFEKLVSFLFSF